MTGVSTPLVPDAPAVPCPRCGTPPVAGDRFCEVCGADLRGQRAGSSTANSVPELRASASPGRRRLVPHLRASRPDATDHMETVVDGGAAISDRGHVRPRNEDAVALGRVGPGSAGEPGRVAAAVCDGVSSTRSSELAARAAADAALHALLAMATATSTTGGPQRGRRRRGRGRRARAARHPGTSVVHAGLRGARRVAGVITVGWVGDSRAYWLAEPGRRRARPAAQRGPHRRGGRRGRDPGSGRRRDPPRCHHPMARRGRRRRAGARRAHPGRARRAPALHRRALEVPAGRGGARRRRPPRAESRRRPGGRRRPHGGRTGRRGCGQRDRRRPTRPVR